jgi:hypothetical protein
MRSIDENVEKLETLYTFDGKIKIHSCYGKWYRDSIKSLIEPPYYPAKKKKRKCPHTNQLAQGTVGRL